ncbi:hypothetical protein ACLB2K_007157 [Fragaria x ananassa]
MTWRQILFHTPQTCYRAILTPPSTTRLARFSTKSTPYLEKVGILEFLNGIGKGAEAHPVAKIEYEIGDIQNLLVTRTLIPVTQRKLILKYTDKYRLGIWRPLARPILKAVRITLQKDCSQLVIHDLSYQSLVCNNTGVGNRRFLKLEGIRGDLLKKLRLSVIRPGIAVLIGGGHHVGRLGFQKGLGRVRESCRVAPDGAKSTQRLKLASGGGGGGC